MSVRVLATRVFSLVLTVGAVSGAIAAGALLPADPDPRTRPVRTSRAVPAPPRPPAAPVAFERRDSISGAVRTPELPAPAAAAKSKTSRAFLHRHLPATAGSPALTTSVASADRHARDHHFRGRGVGHDPAHDTPGSGPKSR